VLLNDWCMAACYSADEDGTVQLPYEPVTGQLKPEVWERWLAWDPVRMADRYADALRSQRAIYIDAGNRDDVYLDLGAEAFRRRSSGSASPTSTSSSSTERTWGSSTRTRSRSSTWPSGWLMIATLRPPLVCLDPATDAAGGGAADRADRARSRTMKIKDGGGASGEAAVALAIAQDANAAAPRAGTAWR
jgi:hypothetical protein